MPPTTTRTFAPQERNAKVELQETVQKKYPNVPLSSMIIFRHRETPAGSYVAECNLLGVDYTGEPRGGRHEAELSAAHVALVDFRDAFPEEHIPPPSYGTNPHSIAHNIEEAKGLYEECSKTSFDLPPGWERMAIHGGQYIYVDHMTREAHYTLPWEVWERKHTSFILQAVSHFGRSK
jgi:hypothetical protein